MNSDLSVATAMNTKTREILMHIWAVVTVVCATLMLGRAESYLQSHAPILSRPALKVGTIFNPTPRKYRVAPEILQPSVLRG